MYCSAFRYCLRSYSSYIDRIGETRNELRALGKSDGFDAMMKALRSPSALYGEYEDYYRIFDETFLGLYPDFVERVNELLAEDSRFSLEDGRRLPKELRTRLKRSALCPKDEFEAKIAMI